MAWGLFPSVAAAAVEVMAAGTPGPAPAAQAGYTDATMAIVAMARQTCLSLSDILSSRPNEFHERRFT